MYDIDIRYAPIIRDYLINIVKGFRGSWSDWAIDSFIRRVHGSTDQEIVSHYIDNVANGNIQPMQLGPSVPSGEGPGPAIPVPNSGTVVPTYMDFVRTHMRDELLRTAHDGRLDLKNTEYYIHGLEHMPDSRVLEEYALKVNSGLLRPLDPNSVPPEILATAPPSLGGRASGTTLAQPSLPVDPAKAQFGGLADAPAASTATKPSSSSGGIAGALDELRSPSVEPSGAVDIQAGAQAAKLKWELRKALLAKGFTPEHADSYLKGLEGASPRQLKNAMDSLSAIQGGAAEPAGSTSAAPVDPTAPKPASAPSTAPSAPSGEPSLPVDPAKAQFGGLADAPTASTATKPPSGFWQRPSARSMARGGVGALGGYMLHEALTGGDGFTPGNIAQGIAGAGLMGLPFAEFTPGMSKGAQAAAVLKGIGPALKSMAVAELGAQGVNMGSRILEDAALNYMMGKGGLAEALKALGGSTATGLGSLAVGASWAGLPTSLAGTAALFTNPVTAIPALVGLTGGAWSAYENAAARKQDMDFMATQKTMDRPMAERASSVNGSPLQKAMHEANQLLPGRRADELKGLSGDLLDAKRKEMEDAYAKAVYAIGQGMQDEGFSPAQMSAMMSRSTGGEGYGFIGGKDTVGATGRREIAASTGPDGFQSNASYLGGDGLGGSFLDAVAALIGMK